MGELWDFNPACALAIAGACLRHTDENPFATLLALSRQTVTHVDTEITDAEGRKMFQPSSFALDEYCPPITKLADHNIRDLLRRRLGYVMWRNWDKHSDE